MKLEPTRCYELPYPPSVNHIYMPVKRGKKRGYALNEKAAAYRNDVILTIGKGFTTITTPIRVLVELFMPDNRKRDLDNLGKALFDAMTYAGVWKDDSLIHDLRIIRRGIKPNGQAIVTVMQIVDD